jgi:CheY-like chemotaxis protein
VRYSDEVEFVDTRDLEQAKQELQRAPAQAIMINSVSVDRLWPAIERARQDLSDIPIIGCSVPPSTEHAHAAHASGYLLKPVTLADLEQALAGMGRAAQRVLVVDDDPDALQLFARMLRLLDSNLEILTACNGSQALDLLRSRQPDVMLLDLVLPDMDGWHVLAIKSQEPELREIPVIVVSAQDPRDQPLESRLLVATMGKGLSLSKLLRCSHELASLLLQPD